MSSWSNDDKTCYETALEIIDRAAAYIEAHDQRRADLRRARSTRPLAGRASAARLLAEILPWLRGQVSIERRFVGTVQDDAKMLRFVNSVDGPRLAALGTSCPDHFLRTKIKPLFVDWDPAEPATSTALEGGARRGPRAVPRGLRGLLRALQAARLAGRCATRTRPSS